jgi:subtilisin family serine protease
MFVCTAAGNSFNDLDPGTSALIAPADAFEVITCGSVASTGELSIFSSDGPTADGRVKPEVLAQGESVWSVWPYDDVNLASASGTSLSTPLVAGAVACLVQAEPGWDVPTVRDRLKRTASYFGSPVPDPLFAYGYGIVDALDALQITGTWTDLGGGVAGTLGTPTLTGTGPLIGTDTITLALTSARPGGLSFFFVGFGALGVPFKGGTLWPALDVPFFGLPIDGSGELTLATPWVPDLPGGLELWFQHWIPDPAAAQGLAASNGLRATIP